MLKDIRLRGVKELKAITIWQPWASLIAIGAKKHETRNWATKYRGPIAIHAAAVNPYKFIKILDDETIKVMLNLFRQCGIIPKNKDFRYLPLGSIVATAELIDCHPIVGVGFTGRSEYQVAWRDRQWITHYPSEEEILFGDWTPGRYAWELVNVKMLDGPIPAKGKQRLWDWVI